MAKNTKNVVKTNEEIDKKLTEDRDKKCEPIAEEIFQIIAKHKITAMRLDHAGYLENYAPVQQEINQLMKDKGLAIRDVNYIWSIVQSMLDQVKNLSISTIQNAFNEAEKKLFAVDNITDVSLQQIDNVLK